MTTILYPFALAAMRGKLHCFAAMSISALNKRSKQIMPWNVQSSMDLAGDGKTSPVTFGHLLQLYLYNSSKQAQVCGAFFLRCSIISELLPWVIQ